MPRDTMQEAHLLRNILAESGIKALVINDMLQGGSGVDIVGWPTLSRVVVSESDTVPARQIALDFEQRLASGADRMVTEESQAVGGEGRIERLAYLPSVWRTAHHAVPRVRDRRHRYAAGGFRLRQRSGTATVPRRRGPLLRLGRLLACRTVRARVALV